MPRIKDNIIIAQVIGDIGEDLLESNEEQNQDSSIEVIVTAEEVF